MRAALVASEMSSTATRLSTATSVTSGSSNRSDDSGEKADQDGLIVENDPDTGVKTVLRPLERAPHNVFEMTKTTSRETTQMSTNSFSTVLTKTTVMTSSKGWRNVFNLPISYDVNMVPSGTLLDPSNLQLLESTGVHPEDYNRRFAVIDAAVNEIYGPQILAYFSAQGIELSTVIIPGGEPDKRMEVRKYFSEIFEFFIGTLTLILYNLFSL